MGIRAGARFVGWQEWHSTQYHVDTEQTVCDV